MQLNVLLGEGRFIVGPSRLDAPLEFPPIFFGDVEPIELFVWRKGNNGVFAVDPSAYQITLQVGQSNTRAELGFWQITTTLGTSKPIASRAQKQDVACALLNAFGADNVTVEGGEGSYIVTLISAGVWALPTASFQGNTLSNVLVFPITSGTTTTPAQYRIEVLEVAPARAVPSSWSSANTTPVSSFTQVNGLLWELTLDQRTDNGFFTLTVDAATTGFISFDANAYQISVELAAAGKSARVQGNGIGGFWILFAAPVTTASVGGKLVILPSQLSNIALGSTGIRELLDGLQFISVKLTLILSKDGNTVTVASADVILQMPTNQPAVIFIDAPQMAGITFAISTDQSYLHVYKNGVGIGDVALDAPVVSVDTNQQIKFALSDDSSTLNVFNSGQLEGNAPLQ